MAANVQEKFSNVRRRLDQLGYRQPLGNNVFKTFIVLSTQDICVWIAYVFFLYSAGIESLPLVERLFADLLHTTESLKNAKLASSKSPRERADIEAQIEPYKV